MNTKLSKNIGSCIVCGRIPTDRCHIRSKGAGGSDEDFNIIPQCRAHHQLQHKLGWMTYVARFPVVMEKLREKGWEVNDVLGIDKLWHEKLRNE